MRQQLTPAELLLWNRLRGDQQLGLRFRRQHRIGSYIADFFCSAANLVIEVDGDSHADRQEYDAKRTYWISQRGLHVVRYTNDDVLKNLDAVLENIASWCSDSARPSPLPSPRKRGEGVSGAAHKEQL